MKIGIVKPPDPENYLIAYQEGDVPNPGMDVVLSQTSVVKCLRALADWLDIRNNRSKYDQ